MYYKFVDVTGVKCVVLADLKVFKIKYRLI